MQELNPRPTLESTLLWHPYQLWDLQWILQALELNLTLDAGLWRGDDVSRTVRADVDWVPEQLARRAAMEGDRRFRELLALLIHAEPLVHDALDSRLNVRPHLDESLEAYRQWRDAQDGAALLKRFYLEFRHVDDWHRQFLWTARVKDPAANLRPLLRHASRRDRERTTGLALLAYDLYDLAEVLRRHMERYTAERLPEEDEVLQGSSGTTDYESPQLREIARQFDVDPQARATWFVEGPTEMAFIRRVSLLRGIDLEFHGVALMNLGGVGNISTLQFRELLERLVREETFTYISLDRERGVVNTLGGVARIARNGLLTGGFKVWERDFEEANFSIDELASVANLVAATGGIQMALTCEDLKAEQEKTGKPIGDVIERLWRRAYHYGGKGEAWGVALADWTIEHSCPPEIADARADRPILTLINLMRTFKGADFRLSREIQVVNEQGELVELG